MHYINIKQWQILNLPKGQLFNEAAGRVEYKLPAGKFRFGRAWYLLIVIVQKEPMHCVLYKIVYIHTFTMPRHATETWGGRNPDHGIPWYY